MLNFSNFILRLKNFVIIKLNNLIIFFENIFLSSRHSLNVKDLNLVFDIGFNLGNYSKSILKKNPAVKIIGIDANNDLLNKSYTHENIKKIYCLVSDKKNNKQNFFINREYHGASTASTEYLKIGRLATGSETQEKMTKLFHEIKEVETKTIDQLIDSYGVPDLIKIDVEGYEEVVIKGLSKKIPKITFEWSEEMVDSLLRTVEHLKRIGFKQFGVVGYFVIKNSKVLHSHKGDPFLIEPNYYDWRDIKLEGILDKERKISYGMIWAK
jgi:FkbM family methyltransferase